MSEKKSGFVINENTTLPIGFVATILGALVGATAYSSFWLATFIGSVTAATEKNAEQDKVNLKQSETDAAIIQVVNKNSIEIEKIKARLKIKD